MNEDDFLYIEDGQVKVSDMAMQIPEFKDFRRYDTSTNKVFFYSTMSYIYYVYKVFGQEKSYLFNLSLPQRKSNCVKRHTGSYKKVSDFDGNKWVDLCVEAYLRYTRTRSEILFDALKDDIDRFTDYVQSIPHSIKKIVKTSIKVLGDDNLPEERIIDVEIEIANTKERLDALKQAKDLDDLYKRSLADVLKDGKRKKTMAHMFEDVDQVKRINIPEEEFPVSSE